MRTSILITALVLSGCAHTRREPFAYAFATGPSRSVPLLIDAIVACRAPATVVTDGERDLVLLDQKRSQVVFDCLSLWVNQHPEADVGKVGFVGTEQH